MKKGLLCMFTCMSFFLVACSGTKKDATGTIKTYKDNVKLGEYKGLELSKTDYQITDQDLQNKIDSILQEKATTEQIKEGKVKTGDTVNIDYEGKIDGTAFEGGTAKNQPLEIGSNKFIPGFEEGLIGVKVGDTVDLDLKFPDDYNSEDLKGKACVFTVKVNYIEGKQIVPEWNDNFVQSTTDFDTVDEYKQSLSEELVTEKEESQKAELQYQAMDKLVSACEFKSLPEKELNSYKESMVKYYTDYAKQYNLEYADFIKQYFGYTEEQMDEKINEMAETSIKQKIACYSVAEKEGIIPTGEEMDEKKLAVAKDIGFESLEDFENQYGATLAEEEVVRDTVLDWLIDNAKVTLTDPTEQPSGEQVLEGAEEAAK